MSILFALLAALFAAAVVLLTKAGLKNVDPTLAFAIQGLFILVITWTIVAAQGTGAMLKNLDRRTWIFLCAAGVCTTLATIFSYRALKMGDATLVSPLERLSLVLAVVGAAIFLKEKLTWPAIVGVGLMVAGAVMIGVAKK